MLGIRLEPTLEARLTALAKKTGRTKSYYAKEAIRAYLEDQEDYLIAIAALERNEKRIPMTDILAHSADVKSATSRHRRMTVEQMLALGSEIAAIPLLDPRSPGEIMDDLNAS